MSFGNTSKDFKIKGANFAGSLKPDPIEVRKVAEKATGMTMAKQKGKFGNFGT
jgi:hypothetical protein